MANLSFRIFAIALALSIGSAENTYAIDVWKKVTGRNLNDWLKEKETKTRAARDKFFHKPINYVLDLPKTFAADVCSAPAQYYEVDLRRQAEKKWQHLPDIFIGAAQQFYSVDLNSVLFAENIHTGNGANQTFGHHVYFTRVVDWNNRDDVWVALHELEHVVQFKDPSYGTAGKLCEYMVKYVGAGFEHDNVDMEQAADRKANFAIDQVMAAMSAAPSQSTVYSNGLAPNQISIRNPHDVQVSYYLSSDNHPEEALVIAPWEYVVYDAPPGDKWFYPRIVTNTVTGNVEFRHQVAGGTANIIVVNPQGNFDIMTATWP